LQAILRYADQQARVEEDTGESSIQEYQWFCVFEGILKKNQKIEKCASHFLFRWRLCIVWEKISEARPCASLAFMTRFVLRPSVL
jgi:hypothetical protein